MSPIAREVLIFVADQHHLEVADLHLDMRVESDFGMGSLDTICFYEDFFVRFDIQNADAFDWGKYVDAKASGWFPPKSHDPTLAHLVKCAEEKLWIDYPESG